MYKCPTGSRCLNTRHGTEGECSYFFSLPFLLVFLVAEVFVGV